MHTFNYLPLQMFHSETSTRYFTSSDNAIHFRMNFAVTHYKLQSLHLPIDAEKKIQNPKPEDPVGLPRFKS